MKRLLFAVVFAFALGQVGYATAVLDLVSGASVAQVTGSQGGTLSYSNANFDGWKITITTGDSFSPGITPYGLDLLTLSATCSAKSGCSSDNLNIYFSDQGFNIPVPSGGWVNSFSSTTVGTGASVSQTAYVDLTNTGLTGNPPTVPGTAIGPVVLTGSGALAGSLFGGPATTSTPYSLELVQVLTATGGSVSYSTDGNITAATAVSEPGSLTLLGFGLLGFAGFSRKKLFKG